MIALLASILILAPPSPELCREFGVAVEDGDTVTGEIVEYNLARESTVRARCQGHSKYGCTIPVAPNQYIIWVVDAPEPRTHEECHALYEESRH